MMNLWSNHVTQYPRRGTIHLNTVLKEFLTEHSLQIVNRNLYRNFLTHLSSLHLAGIITAETVLSNVENLQSVMKVLKETRGVWGRVWREQWSQATDPVPVTALSRELQRTFHTRPPKPTMEQLRQTQTGRQKERDRPTPMKFASNSKKRTAASPSDSPQQLPPPSSESCHASAQSLTLQLSESELEYKSPTTFTFTPVLIPAPALRGEELEEPGTSKQDELELEDMYHVLLDEPDGSSSEQESDTPAITETFAKPTLRTRGPGRDFRRLQEEDRVKGTAVCSSNKVLIHYIDDSLIEKFISLTTWLGHQRLPSRPDAVRAACQPARKRKRRGISPGRETPDLEICFAREVGDSPTCSGSGSGSSPAGSSIQNYVGGKKRKKLQGIGADNLQLVDTLKLSAEVGREVMQQMAREATPPQEILEL